MADAFGTNQAWGKARIEALSDGVFAIALTRWFSTFGCRICRDRI